ncbi:transposase [Candidatus Woesebacteria bacterium]|nr:transposase [Candidatus Woesebacteria bacterium]
MPSRYYKRNFIKGYYYHIYNRGSHKNKVFLDDSDFETFLEITEYYLHFPQGKPLSWKTRYKDGPNNSIKVPNLVKSSFTINCFCLMPNHFHFLVKQSEQPDKENSITNFMRRLMITYAMYFNDKYDQSGNLFQGKYKNVNVRSNDQLLYLSKYIHKNPSEILSSGQELAQYKYSSYPTYLDFKNKYKWVDKKPILDLVSNKDQYRKYEDFVEKMPQRDSLIERVILE